MDLASGGFALLVLVLLAVIPLVLLGMLTSTAARARGLDTRMWFLLGFFCFPIAILFVLLTGKDERGLEQRRIRERELRVCPECAEVVRFEALKCRFCLAALGPVAEAERYDPSVAGLRQRREARSAQGVTA